VHVAKYAPFVSLSILLQTNVMCKDKVWRGIKNYFFVVDSFRIIEYLLGEKKISVFVIFRLTFAPKKESKI
jgi:hypothetical protein